MEGGSERLPFPHGVAFPCNLCHFFSAELHAAMKSFPTAATEEESEIITPSEPFPTYQTYAFQTEIKR